MATEKFSWVPFYTELAHKLLEYKDKRLELIDFIFAEDGLLEFSNYLHLKDKNQRIDDIDPFSFFGMFNRGLNESNRLKVLEKIKNRFNIKADMPSDFLGIPILNYTRNFFYDWNNLKESCNHLWIAFEAILNGNLEPWFEYRSFTNKMAETTMVLYWIDANKYINLDSKNTAYLKHYQINTKINNAQSYLDLVQQIKSKMQSGEIKENSFMEFSYNAWLKSNEQFTWIPFIEELAHKLLEYKDNRQPLVDAFVELTGGRYYKYLQNIDPYTFLSLYLRYTKDVDYKRISKFIKEKLELKSTLPHDYKGIPMYGENMFNKSADIIEQNEQIEMLWSLFEAQINGETDDIEKCFDKVMLFRWRSITLGLYLVNPQEYMTLDKHSIELLKKYSINGYILNNGNGTYQKYIKTIEKIKQKMDAGEIAEKTFPEFVHNARNYNDETVDNIIRDNTMNYKSYIEEYKQIIERKLNLILQGAPGTGKTYSTAALALSICGVTDVDLNDHNAVMERYEQLRFDKEKNPDGQIGFCTFHQSMDYEDFVEGIKPKTINEQIVYEIEPGIFKTMCENAKNITTEKKSDKIDFSKTRVFKMSLGEKGKDDVEIFDYCLENNVIGLGWGSDKDFSQCEKREDFKRLDDTWGATAMEIFKQWMQVGDIVLISDGTKAVKAIARIIGNYEYHKDTPIEMYQFRKVEWLYTGDLIPISKLYNKNLSQQSIYAFYIPNKYGKSDFNNTLKVDVINDIITGEVDGEKPKNYVLIIDEINRGNVSRIFGELITLLEADKRLGGEHPIEVTLPYSKERFGVPKNLYIVGTMNTTDRSVGNIDYAVRRRFAFATLESQRELVEEHSTVQAVRLYDAVWEFIDKRKAEMDFEDLMVGHSYFFVGSDEMLEMRWQYEIKPLLNEYIKDGLLNAETIKTDVTVAGFVENKSNQTQE